MGDRSSPPPLLNATDWGDNPKGRSTSRGPQWDWGSCGWGSQPSPHHLGGPGEGCKLPQQIRCVAPVPLDFDSIFDPEKVTGGIGPINCYFFGCLCSIRKPKTCRVCRIIGVHYNGPCPNKNIAVSPSQSFPDPYGSTHV